MKVDNVGMRSLAVSVPRTVRTNDYFRAKYPEVVAEAERKTLARLWSKDEARARPTNAFDIEMLPYLDDAFRGTIERRVVAPGETALSLEAGVAKKALSAGGMSPNDVDLMIVCSFLPDQAGPGNAAFLAKELGLRRPAWNLESTCSSATVAFQTACALVQAGQYGSVLVVVSCTYSRAADESDTLSWFFGDAAGAFVVGKVPASQGLLGMKAVSSAPTCGTFYYELTGHAGPDLKARIRCTPETGRVLHDTSEPYLHEACEGAARHAGIKLSDVDFFVFNTPTAWFAKFAARALGVDPEKTVSTYTRFANIGPALMPVNLHEAARTGKIKPGDLVMLYSIGSVSTASAAVVRWSEVGLGPAPEPGVTPPAC